MSYRTSETQNDFPIRSISTGNNCCCDISIRGCNSQNCISNTRNNGSLNDTTLRASNFTLVNENETSSISQLFILPRDDARESLTTTENETNRHGYMRTTASNYDSGLNRLESSFSQPLPSNRNTFSNERRVIEDTERNQRSRGDSNGVVNRRSNSNGGRQRRSRNNRQASSVTSRTQSSSETQEASEVSSRHSCSTIDISTAATGISTSSCCSDRNYISRTTVIHPMPSTIENQDSSSTRDANVASASTRGRSADNPNNTSRENGRTRSASANRRRNRRRRRRARSAAGTSNSSRTTNQNLDQNELQRTSLAGNYNLPRASAASSSHNSGVNSNRTNASSTMTDTLEGPEEEATKCQIRRWPHSFSFLFACLSCTLGMFSISRFAILSIEFGPIFIVQFLLLTLLFGIPLLLFFISTGQYLGSGIIDMWRISPIFQGIGVALMLAQGLYGIYNIAIISWLFIYLRDSFVTASEQYRWSYCLKDGAYRRQCGVNLNDTSRSYYETLKLEETVPDYFSGTVLLRTSPRYPQSFTGELRFQTLFNIVVIWMAVFIGLSKGVRSYGKVVYLFFFLKFTGFIIFAAKVIDVLPLNTFKYWILETEWLEFIYNGESWVCAARECFFTWGLLGATMIQMASHNRFKQPLARDALIIVILTLTILILSGVIGVSTVSLIRSFGYEYTASSFETSDSYEFLRRMQDGRRIMRGGRDLNRYGESSTPFMGQLGFTNTPFENRFKSNPFPAPNILKAEPFHSFPFLSVNNAPRPRQDSEHISFLAGMRIIRPNKSPHKYSGYQVVRLATEIIPTYTALLGPRILSAFWVVMFYFTMIVFGLSQQMALVHTVASGLISIRPDHFLQFESSLTFMSCLLGLVFSFPMATEFGEFIVYFFDYTIGCGWWMMVLYVLMLSAIFIIRGKPYSGENICSVFVRPAANCFANMVTSTLAFCWNVVLPIGLMILSIVSFRFGRFAEMFDWTTNNGYQYLPSWVREIGAMMQILPILMVPFVAVIQSCRYFLNSTGQERMHERVNNLYRPRFNTSNSRNRRGNHNRNRNGVVLTNFNSRSSRHGDGVGPNQERLDDPPPKYTPPPSYSTATGARIARFLRQSFRQSVRRFRGETSQSQEQLDPSMLEETNQSSLRNFPTARCKIVPLLGSIPSGGSSSNAQGMDENFPPPDYATVIIETSRHSSPQGTIDPYESTSSSTITALRENNHRNEETTPSLLSLSQINISSQASTLQTEPSRSPSSDDSSRAKHQGRLNSSRKLPESQKLSSTKKNDKCLRDMSPARQINSSPKEAIPTQEGHTESNEYHTEEKHISFGHIGKENIEGACASVDLLSDQLLSDVDEQRLQNEGSDIHIQDTQEMYELGVGNAKSMDQETDNIVTEYTTVVVGKVFSSNASQDNKAIKQSESDQTIYASIEHLNEIASNSANLQYSLTSPFIESPSQDIQKEFEKDFCSVEEALGGKQEDVDDIKCITTICTEMIDCKTNDKDLENSESVRITINFDEDSNSQLLKYNNDLASIPPQALVLQDETDCDLIVSGNDNEIADVQNQMGQSDPPNRPITIIGSEPREMMSSTNTNQNVQPLNTNEGQSAITLEIDTSTSVI